MSENKGFDPLSALPHKDAFFPIKGVYFNAGVQHPVSRASAAAAEEYIRYKGFHTDIDYGPVAMRKKVIGMFAKLINAEPDEITLVGSTTAGENLIIQALDLVANGGRVVTDDLHYFGSYQIYGELKKQGVEVITIRNKNGDIDYKEYENAINNQTTLVALSSVSTFNGHQHDLKKICDLAHSCGALVYADCIHHIGATPFDVNDCGVDFISCGTFKWLMGDQGSGFLYVRRDRLKQLKRPVYGKRQVRNLITHVFPGDEITTDDNVYEYDLAENTEGYFSIWSEPRIVVAQLDKSLQYLLDVGVDRIAAYRQPMLNFLRKEIEILGYKCLTPKRMITPILSFKCDNADLKLGPLFAEKTIKASLYKGHFRIAVSVYNDIADAEYFVKTLARLKD
ncbi:MAG: aminotransferase class V-fold PLP-dependent enzyme [Kordiimonadaceae bacterium]|nr:aminotransferase class V-fold PLP-dependent enzyme [Kordiimonadaceae bacterium]